MAMAIITQETYITNFKSGSFEGLQVPPALLLAHVFSSQTKKERTKERKKALNPKETWVCELLTHLDIIKFDVEP
jgi:hypothetical protein